MHINRRKLLLAGSMLPILTSCATEISKYRGSSLVTLARDLGVCSASYATLKDGRPDPSVGITGCGDPGSARPVDRIFQAASLTKPVIAFGALRLVLGGHLDLGSPVSRYLPDGYTHYHSVLARSPSDPNDIVPATALTSLPVAALLNHTSGLPNWASGHLSFDFPPGQRWGYSGEGFVLLQAVIEAVTGMGLADYFEKDVFGPAGMRDTSLVWRDDFSTRLERGSSRFGAVREIRFAHPVAAASLLTTVADYARFMSALLLDNQILSLTMSRPVVADRELGLDWGFGWGIERGNGGPFIWQWGNNPGFRSFAMASVATKDGFVILTNSESGMGLAVPLAYSTLPVALHNAFRFSMVG